MHELPFLLSDRCNLKGEDPGVPLGYCRTPVNNGVSMLYNTSIFYLDNELRAPKLATVRRTRQTGDQETFSFRVNDFLSPGWHVNVLFFAGRDTGYIELLDVVESPEVGAMDGRSSIHADTYRGEVPALRNSSPHPVFVSISIYTSDDPNRKRPSNMKLVFKPGQIIPVASQPDTVHIDWHAAELQKSSLYPPYWRPDA